ncbi:calmodulin-binding transcription activator 3-like isoform X1 [Mangifera indica]|uniref:calmodulin-binding transcription activator 3-like isoform X1 n=2 Tax=Mangifera indica TaxID=29780 RepID=UPI001CF9E7E5|nr:calmodulin-binding transcription activator 3-like isoform X1 [Mangifera indica]
MAQTQRYVPNQQLDLEQILREAQYRWLRPAEICEILRNYQRFHLTAEPPVRPPAGSLLLFDRKVLRYFRKDGHRWRKKKDGKTVKEAHEKLKAGSVDVLHCYYAHGEDNENFQRRSYWMLDGQLEHIVLVHYREVKEGYKSGVSRLVADPRSQIESSQTSSTRSFSQANSPFPTVQTSHASSPNKVDWNGQALSSELEDADSGDGPGTPSLGQPMSQNASSVSPDIAGLSDLSRKTTGSWFTGVKCNYSSGSNMWTQIHNSSTNASNVLDHNQKFYVEQPSGTDFITHKLTDARLDSDSTAPNIVPCRDRLITDIDVRAVAASSQRVTQVPQERDFNLSNHQYQNYSVPETTGGSVTQAENKSKDQSGELKKLDSFGRWMDQEIGGDCDDSLMASDSGNYWNTLDAGNDDKEVSSLTRHMQLEIDSLAPSLSQEQLFSICDFSPDWAYSGVETKVIVVGTFLGSKKLSSDTKWGCMFGELEVAAEVLTDNVIRCQAPSHSPGRVPFYITCSNRLACSEVREFEYHEKPTKPVSSAAVRISPEEEVCFQTRLAKLLYLDPERKWLDCTIEECDRCKLKNTIYSMRGTSEKCWGQGEETNMIFEDYQLNSSDKLIQNLLRDRLCEWLVWKIHEEGKGPLLLDDCGQGVIHLAASLGYEWAMGPIIAAGVSPNFRDAGGRTALHWASYFGREETVIALVRLGAAPGAVEDPTPAFPGGQTAADLASSRGHKGIAGYLAEADLTSHLSSLTVNENGMDHIAATLAADKATAQVGVESNGAIAEQLSFAAVRKSAHAAALIQQAFRAYSFRYRQSTRSLNDVSEVSVDLVALGSLKKVEKMNHFEDYLHSAAVKIQKKYRGWKGRKDFLKIRNRIVKLQAHVRGHQVRKQYKKVVWSVSIVEKAILRWRRKGTGLRGFRVENKTANMAPEIDKTDEYEFLRIGRRQKYAGVEKALERVKSMVRNPEARDQYMRLVKKFETFKMLDEGSSIPSKNETCPNG